MIGIRRIFVNTLLLLGSEFARIALGLGLAITIARYLGSGALGKFGYMVSLVGILTAFVDLGLSAFYVREAQRREDWSIVVAVFWIRLLAAIAVSAALAIYALSIPDRSLTILLLLGSLLLVLGVVPATVTSVLRAQEKMAYESRAKILSGLLTLVGGTLVVAHGRGIAGVAAVMVASAAVMFVYFSWLGYQHVPRPLHLRLPWHVYLKVLRGAWPFASLSILVMIYFRIDSLMLFVLKGQEALGQYGAAYRIMETGLLLPWLMSASALPPVARYLQTRSDDVIRASLRAMQFMLALAVPTAVFGSLFASPFITLLYGRDFAEAAQIFRILAFALVAVYAASVTSTLITASARPSINTMIALVMVLLNVSLNLIWIPRWSGAGAAAATVVTEWAGLLMGTFYIWKAITPLRYFGYFLRPTIAALVAGTAGFVVPSLAMLPVCLAGYAAIFWASGGMTADDFAFLRALVLRRGPTVRAGGET